MDTSCSVLCALACHLFYNAPTLAEHQPSMKSKMGSVSILAKARSLVSYKLPRSTLTAWLCVVSLSTVSFLPITVSGVLTVAIPTIAKQLGLSAAEVQWPSAVLSLANGALLLPAGGIADAFGRRATFITGLVIYAFSNLGTAFVNRGDVFIAMTAVQGVAIALLQPSAVGMLSSGLPPSRMKNAAWAVFGASQPMGYALGLVIGGLLAEQWPVVFYITFVGSVGAIILSHLVLPPDGESMLPQIGEAARRAAAQSNDAATVRSDASALPVLRAAAPMPSGAPPGMDAIPAASPFGTPGQSRPESIVERKRSALSKLRSFDWIGALLSTSGFVILTFALADAETRPQGFATPYIPALLPLSAVLLGAFWLWEKYLERRHTAYYLSEDGNDDKSPPSEPLVPPSIWNPRFVAMLSVVFLVWLNFNSLPLFMTLAFQEVQGLSPVRTSIYFLSSSPSASSRT